MGENSEKKRADLVWIIAGESSGDGYGAMVAQRIRELSSTTRILGMGCGKMREAGVELEVDSSELDAYGFVEVVRRLPFFLKLLKTLSARIIATNPRSVVLIDYPGFNLQLAKRLHAAGIRVVWYISPQVWAWKKGRIPKLAACVDRMLCIFPFEPAVYEGSGLSTEFVGHPLLESLAPLRNNSVSRDPNLVILLPGSRGSELHYLLRIFLQAAIRLKAQRPELHFHMPLQRESSFQLARSIIRKMEKAGEFPREFAESLEITIGDSRDWICRGAAGIAASGTVTVEAAILGLPLVVSYKLSWLSWMIACLLVHLRFVSIINMVLNRSVYEEFLQGKSTPENLEAAVARILPGGSRVEQVQVELKEFIQRLGGETSVSRRVAEIVLESSQPQH